jgi:hypothetical protein
MISRNGVFAQLGEERGDLKAFENYPFAIPE